MRLDEISRDVKMVRLHYFPMTTEDARDFQYMKIKQDRNGNWYLPEYNVSGRQFQLNLGTLMRVYGAPRSISLS